MILHRSLIALSLLCAGTLSAYADSVAELSESFWSWRAQEQPFSNDDIPRIERPASFVVDWAPKTVAARLEQLTAFEQRWKKLSPATDAAFPHRLITGLWVRLLRGLDGSYRLSLSGSAILLST
jgi:hypothetical protein